MSKNALKPTKDVFNNDHCDVTMTYFTRKITTYLVRINMYATTLCFEFFIMGRQKLRYGKICFLVVNMYHCLLCRKGLNLLSGV